MSEVDPLTIEERFTRDLARRRAIINTQFGGDEEAYVEHFLSELNARYNPPLVAAEPRPTRQRLSVSEMRARRAARRAKLYADPKTFPSLKKAKPQPPDWTFRKADRVIYHQAPAKTWHFCACGKTATRFVPGKFDSKVWVCANCFCSCQASPD